MFDMTIAIRSWPASAAGPRRWPPGRVPRVAGAAGRCLPRRHAGIRSGHRHPVNGRDRGPAFVL